MSMTALCRTLDPAPWLDGQQDAADACAHCPALDACRATTRAQIMVFAIPVGVSQAGVRWPSRILSRPAALARLGYPERTTMHAQTEATYRRIAVPFSSTAATDWLAEEDALTFWVGCPDWADRPAMIFTIEAARHLAGMETKAAVRLLELALAELRTARKD